MARDDEMRSTLDHVRSVGEHVMQIVSQLQNRAIKHDSSKFSQEEFESFMRETPLLKSLVYGSDEYNESVKKLSAALDHHYKNNDHHPQFHKNGIHDMDLIQLLEMLADWKSATLRNLDGRLIDSIVKNANRFGYDDNFAKLLARTAKNLGWVTQQEYDLMQTIKDKD